jgi:hypothetical protein
MPKVTTRTCPACGFKHSLAAETEEAAVFVSEVERQRDSWQEEAKANEETVDEASALLESIEVWANGSTTFPPDLLSDIRLFLGPQRCGACKAGGVCAVHSEEKAT